MKSFLFFILLCTGVPALIGATPMPVDPLMVRSQVDDDNQLELRLINLEQQSVTVTLTALKSNKLVHRESVRKHNGYCARLDLDQIDSGRYLLTVKKGDTVRKQVILKTAEAVYCSDWN